jgi:hypothetical protein
MSESSPMIVEPTTTLPVSIHSEGPQDNDEHERKHEKERKDEKETDEQPLGVALNGWRWIMAKPESRDGVEHFGHVVFSKEDKIESLQRMNAVHIPRSRASLLVQRLPRSLCGGVGREPLFTIVDFITDRHSNQKKIIIYHHGKRSCLLVDPGDVDLDKGSSSTCRPFHLSYRHSHNDRNKTYARCHQKVLEV